MTTPVVRHLDQIARFLFAPLLKRSGDDGFSVVSWDVEQGLTLVVEHLTDTLLIELEDRRDDRACFFRTSRFNLNARLLFDRGRPLIDAHVQLVEAIGRMITQRETRLPDPPRADTGRRAMLREILVDRLLMPEGRGQYYINPYVGCTIGCAYCYVQERADLSRRLEGLPALEWGRYVDVKVNAAHVLRREVARFEPGIVRLSPILTDPYQGAERRFRITRQCLAVLADAGFTPVILTRSASVVEDLEILQACRSAAVGFSIPTDIDAHRATFEPGAEPIDARIEALAACRAAGLATFAVIQPMLPMNPHKLAQRLAPLIDAVRIDRMHSMDLAAPLYAACGVKDADSTEFFDRTHAALVSAFEQLGTPLDALDDLAALTTLGRARNRG